MLRLSPAGSTRGLPILMGLLVAGLSLADSGSASRVRLVDDRGEPLASPVEACFQAELSQACVPVAPGADLGLPPGFRSLRIEGRDHGPRLARDVEIARGLTRSEPLAVPRKATLRIGSRGEPPTAVSLYPLDEPDLRRPAHRLDVAAREKAKTMVMVPAGEFLASLSRPGSAPQLHVLALPPGSRQELDFVARPGWSLVLRATDFASGKPVPGAAVELRGAKGYSRSPAPRPGQTDERGIALFSGLTDAMMEATVRHAGHVVREVKGLLSSPGSFAVQPVVLEAGGTVRATLFVDGERAPGARCEVVRYPANPAGPAGAPEIFFQGVADGAGVCKSRPLAAGPYMLRVAVPEKEAATRESVEVLTGQETALEVKLSPIRVKGTVRLGTEPAQGFHVTLYSDNAAIPGRSRKDADAADTTDEQGEYEITLWSRGKYSLSLREPSGTPAASKRLDLATGEEIVDFQLEATGVSGIVVDTTGKPVEAATVLLRWAGYHRLATTGSDGLFAFPTEGPGPVTLEAHREGYRSAEPLSLEFVSGATLPPVRLVLTKRKTVQGLVTDAAGAPISQVWVGTYAPDAGGTPRQVAATLTRADGTFEVETAQAGAARGFVTGPGCPLAPFEPFPDEQETRIACTAAPAALALVVQDKDGKPMPQANFILRRNREVLPRDLVATHLGLLGLPAETDGSGRLVLAGLSPGTYDVFLASSTSEALVGLGTDHGSLGTYTLAPLAASEIEVRLDWDSQRLGPP